LLYTRPPQTEYPGLVLARRTDKGWQSSVVFDFVPPAVSNMAIDAGGVITFAYLAQDKEAIHLARGQADRWTTEVVGKLPDGGSNSITAADLIELVFLRDRRNRPLIIASSSGQQSGAILCFRPEE
jgi:hypothetical protein